MVGLFDPGKGLASVVVAVDEAADGVDEVSDAGDAAAADGLTGDDATEDLCCVRSGNFSGTGAASPPDRMCPPAPA